MAYALTQHIHRKVFPTIHFMPVTTFYEICKKHVVETVKLVSEQQFDFQWDQCQLDYRCIEEYRQKRAVAVQDITKSALLHKDGFLIGSYPASISQSDEERDVSTLFTHRRLYAYCVVINCRSGDRDFVMFLMQG